MNKRDLKIREEGERVSHWVDSDDWIFVKEQLLQKIDAVQAIDKLPKQLLTGDPQVLSQEVMKRAGAIALIKEWITELEGQAARHKIERQHPIIDDDELINRFES